MRAVLLILLFRVAITAVIILSIHKSSYKRALRGHGALRRWDALKHALQLCRINRGDSISIRKRLRTPERAREIAKEVARLWLPDGPCQPRQLAMRQAGKKPAPTTLLNFYPIGLLHSTFNAIFQVTNQDCRRRAGDGTSYFLVLWEFEVKRGRAQRFQEVYGPTVTGYPFFAAIRHAGTRLFQTRAERCVPHC